MSTQKKKVLVLVDWFLPGYRAGGPIRSVHNLIRWLSDQVDFSVITSDTDHLEKEPYAGVVTGKWTQTQDGIRVYYMDLRKSDGNQLSELIENEKFDYLLLNSMFSKAFTIGPLLKYAGKNTRFQILLAPRGMLAPGALSVKPLKKKIFLRWFRWKKWHQGVTFIATGEHEARDIYNTFGRDVKLKIAPNLPEPTEKGNLDAIPLPTNDLPVFVSLARISPEKNNRWLIEAFLKVKSPCSLVLYGPVGDQNYWEECAKLIRSAPDHLRISYAGAIPPDKIRGVLTAANFFVLPTLGENFGHAIYESLHCGRPVIISDRTPWRGLEAHQAGWDISIENMAPFIEAMEHAASLPPAEYKALCEGALNFAMQFAADPGLLQKNLDIFGIGG